MLGGHFLLYSHLSHSLGGDRRLQLRFFPAVSEEIHESPWYTCQNSVGSRRTADGGGSRAGQVGLLKDY